MSNSHHGNIDHNAHSNNHRHPSAISPIIHSVNANHSITPGGRSANGSNDPSKRLVGSNQTSARYVPISPIGIHSCSAKAARSHHIALVKSATAQKSIQKSLARPSTSQISISLFCTISANFFISDVVESNDATSAISTPYSFARASAVSTHH